MARKLKSRKLMDKSLPPPMFSDGGNGFPGKTTENSQILCLLCDVYGCGCIEPSKTDPDLIRLLPAKLSYARFAVRSPHSMHSEAEKAEYTIKGKAMSQRLKALQV